jgi:hypothetical protein
LLQGVGVVQEVLEQAAQAAVDILKAQCYVRLEHPTQLPLVLAVQVRHHL